MSVSLQSKANDNLLNTLRATDKKYLQKAVGALFMVEVIFSNIT